MTTPGWLDDEWVRDDEALLAQLRSALAAGSATGADRRPDVREDRAAGLDADTIERMYAAARAAFTWRTIDQELELLSIADESAQAPALVRGPEEPVSRTLEFTGRTVSIELEIGPQLIVGQIYPIQAGRLTLLTPEGAETELLADEVGCFTVARPACGPFRLRCTTAEAGVITDWICMT
jgi:hypothetical protein